MNDTISMSVGAMKIVRIMDIVRTCMHICLWYMIDVTHVDVPDEIMRKEHLNRSRNRPSRALIAACGDGHLGAVMALCPMVPDINFKLPSACKSVLYI